MKTQEYNEKDVAEILPENYNSRSSFLKARQSQLMQGVGCSCNAQACGQTGHAPDCSYILKGGDAAIESKEEWDDYMYHLECDKFDHKQGLISMS